MPRWAQDCFYRTVVLGLKPLLLQDIPSSPNKPPQRSSSTCSIESTDSLETASELQACTLNDKQKKDTPVRRSLSIPDYREVKEDENDHRMPFIHRLVDDLHQRLNELEVFYSTISQSSDTRDLFLKQYIEQIFTDLQIRISNPSQHQVSQAATETEEECSSVVTVAD